MDQSKKRRWLHVPSPAMIVACVALFIAMGGTSYAAATLAANSVGSKQIKKNAVTSAKIKSAAVTAAKVKDATLTGAKVKDGSLTGAKIQDGSVAGADLAAGAVDTTKVGTIPGARVKRVAALSVPSGPSTVMSWDSTPDFNVGGVFDPAKPTKMTAPVAGRYLITASVRWDSNANGRRVVALNVNYPATGWAQIARSSVTADWAGISPTFFPEQTATTVYKLNAGDYVEVWVAQDSTSALNLMVNVDNGVTYSMQWLAP
jgi:hypothetical protein